MLSRVAYLGLGIASVLLFQGPSHAHEQAIGLTELTLITPEDDTACTPDTCRLEVAHRLSIHDAESTLMSVLGARADLTGDIAAQARFETYVSERFVITDTGSGEPLPLTLLGGEVERGYYWVYQESQLETRPSDLSITQGVLMDAIPQQTNRVNIRHDGAVNTLVFSRDPGPQSFSFD